MVGERVRQDILHDAESVGLNNLCMDEVTKVRGTILRGPE
jgi:hypothetical protein